jgi:hypothetical protein
MTTNDMVQFHKQAAQHTLQATRLRRLGTRRNLPNLVRVKTAPEAKTPDRLNNTLAATSALRVLH